MKTRVLLGMILLASCAGRSKLEDVPPASGSPADRPIVRPDEVPDAPVSAAAEAPPTPRSFESAPPTTEKVTVTPPTVGPAGPPPTVRAAATPTRDAPERAPIAPVTTPTDAPPAETSEAATVRRASLVTSFQSCRAACNRRTDLSEDDAATCRLECVNASLPEDTATASCQRGCLRDMSPCLADCAPPNSGSCNDLCTGKVSSCLADCESPEDGGERP
jgi:hypothetical protein